MSKNDRSELGSEQWFRSQSRDCKNQANAVISFGAAASAFAKLSELGIAADAEIRSALHHQGVIHYARPFSATRTSKGKYYYPEKPLKHSVDFDREAHRHLRILRDKMIGHADTDFLSAEIVKQWVKLRMTRSGEPDGSSDAFESPAVLGALAASAKILMSLDDATVIDRLRKHTSVVYRIAADLLSESLAVLFSESLANPKNAMAIKKRTAAVESIPINLPNAPLGEVATASTQIPMLTHHKTTEIEPPPLPFAQGGLSYRRHVYEVRRTGKGEVRIEGREFIEREGPSCGSEDGNC